MYKMNQINLIIDHNGGFFSCCAVKLAKICEFVNIYHKMPTVDSSKQFQLYKIGNNDITFDYFKKYNIDISINGTIDFHWDHQWIDYSKLKFLEIKPVFDNYFTPTNEIINIVSFIEKKYNLNYDNICVLFYRGNDKNRETTICNYDEYLKKANEIKNKHPTINFLIQSDETGFINEMLKLSNSFYFKDECRHMNKCNSSVDLVMRSQNHIFSKFYLAITIIMSKCKYIVCGTGNCSLFIMLYRNNVNNVYQNHELKWLNNINI